VKEIHATIRLAAILGLVPFGLLAIAGPQLFTIVFGTKWQEAGNLAQVAALLYFVSHVFSPSMPTLIVLNRLRTQQIWDIGRVVFMISCLWTMVNIGAGPNLLILTIPSVMAGMYCLHYYLCVRAARRL
jgi:O-antigen/teichoic acid export membrane protein